MSFRRWLRNWLHRDELMVSAEAPIESNRGNFEDSRTLNFNITPARGGMIVTNRYYNKRRGEYETNVHVIPDDADIPGTISQIVSMELLSTNQ